MLACQHSGLSVDAGVCIEAHDRAALERLSRYGARPPFAMDRLRKEGAPWSTAAPNSTASLRVTSQAPRWTTLTPLELMDRIAALAPPPRTHRHRYFGVLAPNSPLRASVTAMAQAVPAQIESVPVESATTSAGALGVAPLRNAFQAPPDPETAIRIRCGVAVHPACPARRKSRS